MSTSCYIGTGALTDAYGKHDDNRGEVRYMGCNMDT